MSSPLFIRTVGIKRAQMKIGMANLVYKFRRIITCGVSTPHDRSISRRRRHHSLGAKPENSFRTAQTATLNYPARQTPFFETVQLFRKSE